MTEINDQTKNLVIEEHIPTETTQFSLQCNALGTDIYKEYIDTRYINKSKKLFHRLPLVKILVDKKQEQEKKIDLRKETMKFSRKIDVARSRQYDIYKLLSYEILENSYFLTKKIYLPKHAQHELVKEIQKYLSQPSAKKTLGKKKMIPKKCNSYRFHGLCKNDTT